VFDEDGRLVDLNRAAAVALGREAGDLAGMPADEVLAPLAPVRDFLRTAAPDSPRELTMDGRVLEARLLPIDGGGNVLSLDDITERKRGEEQLRLAKEAAEAAEAAQGRFLAMMSHEVRTPMNGMLGFAQILADTPLNEEQRECVEQIDRNGRALLVILNDVLDFSKITAGHLAVEQVPCDVAELARNTCKLFEHQAHEKGLGLDCRVAPGFPASVAADPVRIGQVLTNLLGNALKFTESGGISVDLELMPTPTGPIVAVRVHDTGAGIAPSEQERIFRPFEQADASTTRRFGGTGLGLTITRSLCELMGGSLTVSSEPGKGSTFTATFRVGAPLLSDAPASTPDRTAAAAEPMRLLVFEDNVINQRVIQALLEKQGHRVRLAADGAQGLAFLAEDTEGFDAILMDIEMPVMDGFEAVRRIRSSDHPGDRNRHIIALTAHAMAGERQRALAAGCNDFLTKPVRSEDLRAALARVPRPVRTSR
jgi:signal transduction histidine kinase/CheY-like chemotaxis protein